MIDFKSRSALISKHIDNHVQGQAKMRKFADIGPGKTSRKRHLLFALLSSALHRASRGQAMVEYVIIAGLLMASLGIFTVFFVTFKEYGGRILALVSSEYP